MKLCTGEQLMATLVKEYDDGILVQDPIQVKMVPMTVDGEYVEQAISNSYCQFTEDKEFFFKDKDMVYYKPLHPGIVKYYSKLVLAFGEERNQLETFYKEKEQEKNLIVSKKFH
jgi:hypothetical protein